MWRKQKRHSDEQSAFREIRKNYFAPRMASLAAFATRNFTTFLAGMLICSPVAGLRPIRALRFTSTSLPRPGSVKLFFAFLYARSVTISRICTACFLVMPALSATAAAICDFERAFAIVLLFYCFYCFVSALSPATRCVLKPLKKVVQEIFLKFSREFTYFCPEPKLDLRTP